MSTLPGWFVFAAGGVLTVLIAKRYPQIALIMLSAFALRVGAALLHYYVVPLPDGTTDAVTYERWAWVWAQDGLVDVVRALTRVDSYSISRVLGVLYALTDRSPLLAQGVSVILGTGSVYLLYRLICNVWDEFAGRKAAWVAAVFPTLVLYSALTMREAYIWFFLLYGLLGVAYWANGERKGTVMAVVGFGGSTYFHGAMIFSLLGFFAVIAFRSLRKLLRRLQAGYIWLTAAVVVVFSIGVAGSYVAELYEVPKLGAASDLFDSQRILEQFDRSSRGTAGYPDWLVPDSLLEIPVLAPVRAVHFLFSPFLWQLESVRHLFGLIDAALYMIVTILIWNNKQAILNNTRAKAVLVVMLPVFVLFAVAIGNFGTGIRHRTKLLWLGLLLAAPMIPRLKMSRKSVGIQTAKT